MQLAAPTIVAALLLAAPAAAELCSAEVNASEILVDTETLDTASGDGPGLRERLLAWPTRSWDRALGRPPACDSETLIRYLAAEAAAEDIDGYCLLPSEESGFLLVPGERNFRGRCKTTTCDKVNAAADTTLDTSVAIAAAVQNKALETKSSLDTVAHGSGAMILSGTREVVLGTLGSAGSAALTAMSAPAAMVGAGVTVIAVGGAVYYCSGSDAQAESGPPGDGLFQDPGNRDPSLQ